jgi:hypothetical protein
MISVYFSPSGDLDRCYSQEKMYLSSPMNRNMALIDSRNIKRNLDRYANDEGLMILVDC